MQSNRQRGAPSGNRGESSRRTSPDWESIRWFLEVARCGSFRAAAERTNVSINLLRRRIMDLEHALGLKLLTRQVTGVTVTPEGQPLLTIAAQMETASFSFAKASDRSKPIEGRVRLTVTEGLGTFWVVPRLVEFQRAYPKLLIDLNCAMISDDVETDVAIQLERPTSPDLKSVRLGRMHIFPFVSRSYVDTYGCPTSHEELLRHRIVLQMADRTRAGECYDQVFPGVPQLGFVSMTNNVSSAHYWAIAKGAGIGWLPTYAMAIGARVMPVNIGHVFPYDIWLAYHPDAAQIPRVRRLIDWTAEAFDARTFPWFSDEFIHPDELMKSYKGAPLANLFEGFLDSGIAR
ncbi:LysR family transcriptional regulator [Bradyrhizobium prioriisuperbiae]|uniref:LysR family transcriptional regulator n=1 Tax=Bradyrhizobium prioriisuperbiae TaxID=2854389 RepID=UPI0028E73D03|nr:LysR family transcriptional regulator [Bradyrhizobium prioritasuperba]